MPIFYGICPHCDAGKAVEVELETVQNGMDGPWAHSFTSATSSRVPEEDECACVLTPEQDQAIIASAEEDAIYAEPDYPEWDGPD